MVTKKACSLVIAVFLCCLSATTVTGADANPRKFRIDSYIPEKFVDFEWRIGGRTGASSSDQESDGTRSDQLRSIVVDEDNNQSEQHLSLSSLWGYEHVTIPEFLKADLSLTVSLSHASDDQASRRSDTLGESYGTSLIVDESDNFGWGIRFGPSLSLGKYIVSDWYLSTELRYFSVYSETPDSDGSRDFYYRQVDTFDDQPEVHRVVLGTTEREHRSDNKSHRVNADFLVGWGRVYTGEFASTAMYMAEELRRENLLQRELTYDEMMALTDTIYQYRQRHVIDRRIRRIEALGAVLSYLEEAGAISDPGPYGYLIIQDVWDYFPRGRSNSREFGYRISAGPGIEYNRSSSQRTSVFVTSRVDMRVFPDSAGVVDTIRESSDTSHRYDYMKTISKVPSLTGQIEYHKPLSRRWQYDSHAGVEYYIDAYTTIESEEDIRHTSYDDYYRISASTQATYIYDSRTLLRLRGQGNFSSRATEIRREIFDSNANDPEPVPDSKRESWNWSLYANLEYRMAIPTTLHLTISYRSNYYQSEIELLREESRSDDRISLSARLEHYLY